MKKPFLIDSDYKKYTDRLERIYKCTALIAIKHGQKQNYTDEHIESTWQYDDEPPSKFYIQNNIKVGIIKWYINKMKFNEGLWSNDFLHGLTCHGKITWSRDKFPSFIFGRNQQILSLFKKAPLGGAIYEGSACRWKQAPALCLDYSMDSIEFIAGIMAGFEKVNLKMGGKLEYYARASKNIIPYLKEIGIPFYQRNTNSYFVFILPIWPALFSPWIPCKNNWTHLKSSMSHMYAAIIWRMYVKKTFQANQMPYLHGRTKIFNMMGDGRGKMRRLEKKRLELGLTQVDKRIGHVARKWAQGEIK
ncbi:MAG: hypothetical protein ACOCWG_03395 [bacterium]